MEKFNTFWCWNFEAETFISARAPTEMEFVVAVFIARQLCRKKQTQIACLIDNNAAYISAPQAAPYYEFHCRNYCQQHAISRLRNHFSIKSSVHGSAAHIIVSFHFYFLIHFDGCLSIAKRTALQLNSGHIMLGFNICSARCVMSLCEEAKLCRDPQMVRERSREKKFLHLKCKSFLIPDNVFCLQELLINKSPLVLPDCLVAVVVVLKLHQRIQL